MLALALAASISIHTTFSGGALGPVERVSDTHFRLSLKGQKDQDGRNRQANWYYFQVRGATLGQEVRIDLVDLPGEYNYKPNRGAVTADTPAVISYDGKTWTHITNFEYDPKEPAMTLRVNPKRMMFWIAHTPPYTITEFEALRVWANRNKNLKEQIIGRTVEGRPILQWTIGDGPKTAWLMFRQHSWESGSSWAGEGAVRALLESPELRQGMTWQIFPMCDPDGVEHGGVRFNVNGYDLNRNWDVSDPKKMPEIAAQRRAIDGWIQSGRSIDFFLSLHNTETAEYLEGPPEMSHLQLAARLFGILKTKTSFAPTRELFSSELTTTAGMKGRMNVAQGLYSAHHLPAFLMEQRISMNPKLKRLPLIEDRVRFGRELVQAVYEALH